jgi:aspartyl-tRNA(Asn)/glutamyl-tRNA(Gln) amidotransferase subunit A
MPPSEYCFATVGDLARSLRQHEVSPTELAEAAHAALASIGPHFNTVAALLPERSRREAERAERRLAGRGDAPPLCGIPYGVKDLYAAWGGPTTWGVPTFRERVLEDDATAVRRLARAGGVLSAKLNMVELAGAGRARIAGASLHGSGRNPWDPARYAGGSSSGSAIAVAAGLLPYALGSETGGSIVGPSAFCGITGLRPTYGLVPRTGALMISPTLDKLGPLARTAEDCATVLEVISGSDGVDRPSTAAFRPLAADEVDPLLRATRVAFLEDELDECADHTRGALACGVDELRGLVPRFVSTGIRRDLAYGPTLELIMLAEAATALAPYLERPDFELVDADQLADLRRGLTLSARDYLDALRVRDLVVAEFQRVFGEADVILTVSRTGTAPLLGEERPRRTATSMSDILRAAGNIAGIPAISFPCGLAEDGLPVGLQLIGPRRSDARLLAIAGAYQRATRHHLRRPPNLISLA